MEWISIKEERPQNGQQVLCEIVDCPAWLFDVLEYHNSNGLEYFEDSHGMAFCIDHVNKWAEIEPPLPDGEHSEAWHRGVEMDFEF